ncbi:MAG: hypothetical protein KAT48_12610 [Bacteroidales bacterium]|nr:hypothetical protein [Bacteroidales bacterium]
MKRGFTILVLLFFYMSVNCQSFWGINSGLQFTKYVVFTEDWMNGSSSASNPDFTVGFVYKYGHKTSLGLKINAEYVRKSFSYIYSFHNYTYSKSVNNDYKSDCIFINLNSEIGGNYSITHLNLGFYVGLLLNPKKHTTISYYPYWGPNAPSSHIIDSKADELARVNAGFLFGVGLTIPINTLILITIDSNIEYGLTNFIVKNRKAGYPFADKVLLRAVDCKLGIVFNLKKDN